MYFRNVHGHTGVINISLMKVRGKNKDSIPVTPYYFNIQRRGVEVMHRILWKKGANLVSRELTARN